MAEKSRRASEGFQRTTLDLSSPLKDALEFAAENEGCSMVEIVEEALVLWLEKREYSFEYEDGREYPLEELLEPRPRLGGTAVGQEALSTDRGYFDDGHRQIACSRLAHPPADSRVAALEEGDAVGVAE